ncbi:8-amino-7-oxononanoate synthase [Merismopedia glauca]|uniref:8-amino-7-ketopelargonate synthase n=1 Tax=Merismopedia glauca CCAP 1448/3 TaxID=1296344 RepID=A0A2T1C473_9CYAN|nr:8-amino-7-oxononanoate synthase [Merismopedia glauca]PSB02968.1 8-amino-7-oxononanoate synthase [Merismopedia glauca CCAP 1448/3]
MLEDSYLWIEKSLTTIHQANWYRSVRTLESLPGAEVVLEGKPVINFASNDYLGLAGDYRLIEAAIAAIQTFGTGSTGSRLMTGHRELHRQLELEIAALKQTEDALVFSSGYLANLGAIASLVGARDLILADEYNHSSLKNGGILSQATQIDYQHCNLADLSQNLAQYRSHYRRCLIVSDTVFSMDGDLCPLPEILELAEAHNCMVLVDEAHATGVFGDNGAGCVEYFGLTSFPLIQIGTLSKSLGSLGGYVAGSKNLVDFLRNRAASFIYTTALSIADTATALAALKIIRQEPEHRQQLWENVSTLKQLISQELPEINLLPSASPIICISMGSPSQALQLTQQLREQGIFAPAIRPPTVPTSRIRLTLMATHETQHLQALVAALKTSINRHLA